MPSIVSTHRRTRMAYLANAAIILTTAAWLLLLAVTIGLLVVAS